MHRASSHVALLLWSTACSGTFLPVVAPGVTGSPAGDSGLAAVSDTAAAASETGVLEDSGDPSSGGEDTGGPGEEDTAEEALPVSPNAVADFELVDLNPRSPTSGQPVSPRDLLSRVSGWYFLRSS